MRGAGFSVLVFLPSVVLKHPWLCPQAERGGVCSGVQQEQPHLRGGATTSRGPLREENMSGEDLDFYHG